MIKQIKKTRHLFLRQNALIHILLHIQACIIAFINAHIPLKINTISHNNWHHLLKLLN